MANLTPPDFVELDGDWSAYVEELYRIYLNEIVHGQLELESLPIRTRYHPATDNKGYGFWHIISDGKEEEERLPDMRRCERIRWVRFVIENADKPPAEISWWKNKRGNNTHIVIWYEDKEFAVVLAERRGYLLLKTAYMVKPHRGKSFQRERDEYWKDRS